MKEKYEPVEMEIVIFDADVITTSCDWEGEQL